MKDDGGFVVELTELLREYRAADRGVLTSDVEADVEREMLTSGGGGALRAVAAQAWTELMAGRAGGVSGANL